MILFQNVSKRYETGQEALSGINLELDDGDMAYSFTDGRLIKSIQVTQSQLKQLSNGRLCIISLDGAYELIPTLVAEKIQKRDESVQILSNQSTETPEEDDPYADYRVPDDLMW